MILVTGGTGFVGSHTAARLVASGRPVRLLVRDPAKVARAAALRDVPVEIAAGDVTDRRSVDDAISDCTGLVHAAAHLSLARREAEHALAVNEGGTRNLLAAAAARGIPAVAVSSISVFARQGTVISAGTPLIAGGGAYTRSKVAAEHVARDIQATGAPVAIVYPTGVLGPDSPDMSVNHQALVGWLRTPPKTTSGTALVDVRDVATGIVRALDHPGRWVLGGTFLTWAELHAALTEVTGVRRRAVPMPPRLLRTVGRAGDLVKRFVDFDYPLTHEAMTMATASLPCDSTASETGLGVTWRPVNDTLADSVRWLAAEGRIPPALAGRLAG